MGAGSVSAYEVEIGDTLGHWLVYLAKLVSSRTMRDTASKEKVHGTQEPEIVLLLTHRHTRFYTHTYEHTYISTKISLNY